MASNDMRQPPRFVPTLTDVVNELAMPVQAVPARAVAAAASRPKDKEMAEIPDLQQMPDPSISLAIPNPNVLVAEESPAAEPDWEKITHALQVNVMERLEEKLNGHMREAFSEMVHLHTQALYRSIRQDVECLVSAAVLEAIEQEMAKLSKQHLPR